MRALIVFASFIATGSFSFAAFAETTATSKAVASSSTSWVTSNEPTYYLNNGRCYSSRAQTPVANDLCAPHKKESLAHACQRVMTESGLSNVLMPEGRRTIAKPFDQASARGKAYFLNSQLRSQSPAGVSWQVEYFGADLKTRKQAIVSMDPKGVVTRVTTVPEGSRYMFKVFDCQRNLLPPEDEDPMVFAPMPSSEPERSPASVIRTSGPPRFPNLIPAA